MMQLIAMMTMLIDHVGFIFFPQDKMFRIIGRIAFPIYCWLLVQGYLHTRNHKKYMIRLFWLACISQVPYTLALERLNLNVIFTLLIALFGLYAAGRLTSETQKWIALAAVFAISTFVPMDYGVYGVLLVFIYRYLERWQMIAGHLTLELLFFFASGAHYSIQMLSILGTLLIAFPLPIRPIRLNKWLYRSFYPLHLAVLFILLVLIERF